MVVTISSSNRRSPDPAYTGDLRRPRNQLVEFCEDTTLNGWYYLVKQSVGKTGRSFWSLVVTGSLVIAAFFVYGATEEFHNSTVIITLDSVTGSLETVPFPSLVVCNHNQVKSTVQVFRKKKNKYNFNYVLTLILSIR